MSPPREPRLTRRMIQAQRRAAAADNLLNFSQAAAILSANKAGEIRSRAYDPVTEGSLKNLQDITQKRRMNEANKLLREWHLPSSSFPFGTASFLVSHGEKVARELDLYDKAACIVERHNSDCPSHCVDVIHPGQDIPDVSIALLPALDSSISNFSRVVAVSPRLLSDDTSDHTFGLALEDEVAMKNLTIYSLPGTLSTDDRKEDRKIKRFMNDLLVEDLIAGIQNISLDTCTKKIMCFQNEQFKFRLSFKRILQHWAVSENIAHNSITRFLRLLHFYQPETICYQSLPRTGRALLSTSDRKVEDHGFQNNNSVCKREGHELFCECPSKSPVRCGEIRPFVVPNPDPIQRRTEPNIIVGNYVHFGLEKAIAGKSFGLLYRYHYRLLLRYLHEVRPGFLPDMFLDLTRPCEDEPFNRNTWEKWIKPKKNAPLSCKPAEPVVFQMRINVDGAQFFESSHIKGTPIQAKIVGVRSLSGDIKFRVPYELGKSIMVGLFEQTRGKPPSAMLMEDTVKEMVWLQPSTLGPEKEREGEPFAVEVICFNCDAPMRADLKGIKSCTGYYGCERCETKGEHHVTKGQSAPLANVGVKMKFRKQLISDGFDAEGNPRTRVHWLREAKIVNKGPNAHSRDRDLPQQDNSPASSSTPSNDTTKDPHSASSTAAGASSSSSSSIAAAASTTSSLPASSSAGADVVGAKGSNAENPEGGKRKGRRAKIISALECTAVLSKRKKRQQAYDDGYEEGDDADYETDDVTTIQSPTDTCAASSAAATLPSQQKDAPAHPPQQKKDVGKEGGSVYFPEIGAKPRTDEMWRSYKFTSCDAEVTLILMFSVILYIFLK